MATQQQFRAEDFDTVDPRVIIKDNIKLVFSIGMVFEEEDQILFDNIIDFFDNRQRTYLDVPYVITDFEDVFIQQIEDRYEIGNGNYHLMMTVINPHNNNVTRKPITVIEDIVDFIIDFHQRYGTVNETIPRQQSNLNRQQHVAFVDDYPTKNYINQSQLEQQAEYKMYHQIDNHNINDKMYYKNQFDLGFEFKPIEEDIREQLNDIHGSDFKGSTKGVKPNRFKKNNLNGRMREDRTKSTGPVNTTMESFLENQYESSGKPLATENVRSFNHGYYNRMFNQMEYEKQQASSETSSEASQNPNIYDYSNGNIRCGKSEYIMYEF